MAQVLGSHVVIFITCPSVEEAEKIAKTLLDKKLVACINIVSEVKSFFWWKEKVEEAKESLLIIKTRVDKISEIIETVRQIHSYTVPEIIAIPIISGFKEYLKWVDETIGR